MLIRNLLHALEEKGGRIRLRRQIDRAKIGL
jgi:hypothetical protein